jgi:hypothetical protein
MIRYYLFGLNLISHYNLEGLDKAISALKKDPSLGTTYKFNPKTEDVNTLLNDFSGWGDFMDIDKLTYDKINKECN